MKNLRDTRVRVFSVLILLWLVAWWREGTLDIFLYPLLSILLFALLDVGYTYWIKKKWYYPFSSLVSGLIIGFLIHPSEGILTLLIAIILGWGSKQFIKLGGRHIFNPAAFGAVTSTLIMGTDISWWAVAPGSISILLTLFVLPTLYKLKRWHLPIIFLIGYFLFFLIIRGVASTISLTLDGTVFFFSFVMLTEPMTTIIKSWWNYGFSLIVLGILIFLYLTKISFTDPLLLALLATNLLGSLLSKKSQLAT